MKALKLLIILLFLSKITYAQVYYDCNRALNGIRPVEIKTTIRVTSDSIVVFGKDTISFSLQSLSYYKLGQDCMFLSSSIEYMFSGCVLRKKENETHK